MLSALLNLRWPAASRPPPPPFRAAFAALYVLRTRSQVRAVLFHIKKTCNSFRIADLWWTIQDSNLRWPAASRPPPPPFRAAFAALYVLRTRSQVRAVLFRIKKDLQLFPNCRSVVDDTRLELVTSRTSSGCATSCANRPALFKQEIFYMILRRMSRTFF